MAWNDDFTTADWASATTLNLFKRAIWERQMTQIIPSDWGSTPTEATLEADFPMPTVAVGTDVQTAGFWSLLQGDAEALVSSALFLWVRDASLLDGHAYPWLGDDITNEVALFYFEPRYVMADAGFTNWMRKRPREISSPSQYGDDAGNAPATGQIAFYPADGRLYTWSGSAWVFDSTATTPDVLVGEEGLWREIETQGSTTDTRGFPAQEGMIASCQADDVVYEYMVDPADDVLKWMVPAEPPVPFVPDTVPTGNGVLFGRVQAGDYLGPWVMNQLRDYLNQLTISQHYLHASEYTAFIEGRSWHDPPATSFDGWPDSGQAYDALAAELAYAQSHPPQTWSAGGGSTGDVLVTAYVAVGRSSSTNYFAIGGWNGVKVYAETMAHVARTAKIYAGYETYTVGADNTFDTQGLAGPATPSLYSWDDFGSIAAGTLRSSIKTLNAGALAGTPPSLGSPSVDGHTDTHGFKQTTAFAVVTWSFTQGPP